MLKTAIEAARRVGQILLEEFRQPQEISFKGLRDVVTETDLAAQARAIEIIRSQYPDHDIWAEEVSQTPDGASDYCWIIDPLDGTTNYSRGFPCFSVSIALSHRGKVILGVVHDPLHDQMFRAQLGQGAYLNGDAIQVSSTEELIDALIGLDWANEQELRYQVAQLVAQVAPQVRTLRNTGSAALGLCSVAAGWIDAYFHLSLKPWDVAAGGVIIQEAGGAIGDLTGRPWRVDSPACLASNGRIHQTMLDLITGLWTESR